jgi:hypothetical protein
MAGTFVLHLFILVLGLSAYAKVDRIHAEAYLGQKDLESYSERYQPLVFQDIYRGKITFEDERFFQNFFRPYLFQKEEDYAFFLQSELNGGLLCPNDLLAKNFDEIRYSYRLITLSYLLEGAWHMKLMADHLKLKNACAFDLKSWVKTCTPKSPEMRKFLTRLDKFSPKYTETLPSEYRRADWWKEFKGNDLKWFSQYRIKSECQGSCTEEAMEKNFALACREDQELMQLICSEEDEIYGLSTNRDAYYLLGLSNIINTYNQNGEALGCLRRFSEVMGHKEVRYEGLRNLFPIIQSFLRARYQERFLQGRVFFFGSGKEFEEKGLQDLYVKEQPIQVAKLPLQPKEEVKRPVEKAPVKEAPKVAVEEAKPAQKVEFKEIKKPVKSAFLQAAEVRSTENLERVDVDMLKLKYDYVFSLNMLNTLSQRLKTFMTREALKEMMSYDKLGTREAPVPLMFLKYMIDMQEHQGLWNIISVLGDKFYVSNEIDSSFNPAPEFVQLVNNETTGRQWQLYILRP